jgi:diguanylate cyclase (GGDEF)-like protein
MDPKLCDEAGRIASLNRYCVLDSGREQQFDRITELVQTVFKVPIAAVTLVDVDRQWFKSNRGLDVDETMRDVSFCTHTILSRDALNVGDALQDARFASNPLVTGEPHIRAYLGAPLETPDGYNVGALCAIDRSPRTFGAADEALLASFAALVVDELELRMIGQSDYLTGAKTRRAFLNDLEAACRGSRRGVGALLMLDLDHFKRINDVFGHPAGDAVLQGVASACRDVLRRSDAIGRFGGEEFGILLAEASLEQAMECADRIRQSLAELRILPDPNMSVTASFGITALVSEDAALTVSQADMALYRAKAGGRNRCVAAIEMAARAIAA